MKLHKKITSYFNMVEVALALAVVGLGVTGIMSLFPVGINSARDAIGDNYAADTADQLLHYLARACEADWDTMIWNTSTNSDAGFTSNSSSIVIANDKVSSDWLTPAYKNIYSDHSVNGTKISNVYGIKQKSGDIEDFVAHIKVWKSQVNVNGTAIPFSIAAALNIEISWPVAKRYDQRTKRHYYYEIYNKN